MDIGEVLKPQGIRGEIKVRPLTDDSSRFRMLKTVYVDGSTRKIESVRISDGAVYVKLMGINDRNEAEKLRGKLISIERSFAVPLSDGEFYVADLVGAKIVSRLDGKEETLGTITRIESFGAADVFTVDGDKKFTFAFVKALNAEFDGDKKILFVDGKRLQEVAVYED
ncbi:MAG: 16S rRNA processing protein RimM [Clostridiales bacterium]|nr:16S rRNA processing protein RimM [Clostridiales bacterium]